jgi:Holliday junction resolvase RusA-like endonuclease
VLKAQKMRIRGVPYPKVKSTGNVEGPQLWTEVIVEKTQGFRKVTGPCLLRVTFRLPKEKFHEKNPFGTDLDNLLKRFLDALSRRVFCDAPGKDACVVSLEATKVAVANPLEAGVDGEIVEIG